ncbi:MAG: DUF5009 domain-containing protein [Chitinophagaceae bacterium]
MNQRYYSLDVFRGATVALMILVNNPGSWSAIYSPLEHAPWHGCTPTDLVFPFFLFAVGNAMAFVMPRLENAGTVVFLQKVFKRTVIIIGIGLLLNWSPFVRWQDNHLVMKPLVNIRFLGVLQRIALCYLFATLIIYYFKARGALIVSVILLIVYWILCFAFGNRPDPYSLEGFWGTQVDRFILGNDHLYQGEGVAFDPEGLVSTLSAIVQVIIGYLAGRYLRLKSQSAEIGYSPYQTLTLLFVTGSLLIFTGLCWNLVFPINKKLWTSSYVVYTSGLAITVLALTIYLIEVRKHRGFLTRFFDVFGKNPLFIFVLSGFLPRVIGLIRIPDKISANGMHLFLTPFAWFYEQVCKPVFSNPKTGSLLYAVCMVVFYWLIAYLLDKNRVYIKV